MITLSTVAKYSNMSPYHFLRVFKKVYGETPNEFLIRLRVEKAKSMLITENVSVSEVCERVGYISLGSFSSLFCKQVGMAPTLYRRKLWSLSNQAFHFPSQAIPACYAYHFLKKPVN
jgi:AraC-like DNA-binding protein